MTEAEDATALLGAMAAGRLTAAAVVSAHLDRLEAAQPRLNAATAILREQAMAEAAAPRPGPLSGLPISVKETCGLAGAEITAGSLRMPPRGCPEEPAAVARLRRAGAIVVARSNVPEFAMAGETDNPRYGRTENPLAPGRTCGGSSGGEGAIVALGGSAAGLGSDILGSIRIPAAFCGIVGFKPASAAVDKGGSWPDLAGLWTDSWLALGPLTRSVRDARLVYGVLSGRPLPPTAPVTGLRLVLPEGFPLAFRHPRIPAAVQAAREALLGGGLVAERRDLGRVGRWYGIKLRYLAWELFPLLRAQLTDAGGRRFSLVAEAWRRARGQGEIYDGLFRLLAVGGLVRYRSARRARRARAELEAARAALRALLGTDGVMLLPTLGTLAPHHGEMNRLSLRPGVNGLFTPLTLCNYLDLPAITVPAPAFRDPASGLVPGVMLVAAPGAEARLLDAAEVVERGLARRAGAA